jgi:hypothetical protein
MLGLEQPYSVSLLSCPSARQLSRIVPQETGFLCDDTVVLGDRIKETPLYASENYSAGVYLVNRCY